MTKIKKKTSKITMLQNHIQYSSFSTYIITLMILPSLLECQSNINNSTAIFQPTPSGYRFPQWLQIITFIILIIIMVGSIALIVLFSIKDAGPIRLNDLIYQELLNGEEQLSSAYQYGQEENYDNMYPSQQGMGMGMDYDMYHQNDQTQDPQQYAMQNLQKSDFQRARTFDNADFEMENMNGQIRRSPQRNDIAGARSPPRNMVNASRSPLRNFQDKFYMDEDELQNSRNRIY